MKQHYRLFAVFTFGALLFLFIDISAQAQGRFRRERDKTVTFDTDDRPYDLNNLFFALQPLYADIFSANTSIGVGGEVTYFTGDNQSLRFYGHGRTAYARSFDVNRQLANFNWVVDEEENGPNPVTGNDVDQFVGSSYIELGAGYTIKDQEVDKLTTMTLVKKKYTRHEERMWHNHTLIEVPVKVRRIIRVRAGGMRYENSVYVEPALSRRGVDVDEIIPFIGSDTSSLQGEINMRDNIILTNMDVVGVYAGASISWFRNLAIKPKGYAYWLLDDRLLTVYGDIIGAPLINVDNVLYNNRSYDLFAATIQAGDRAGQTYLRKNYIGGRIGAMGYVNHKFGWAWNAEIGYRPGIGGLGTYGTFKLSFPVYAMNTKERITESFGN